MTRCTACNWSRHDVSVHSRLCAVGHPLDVPGATYANGQCRRCQRERSRGEHPLPPRAECAHCGEAFQPRRWGMVYCSARCRNRAGLRRFAARHAPPGAPGETTGPTPGGRSAADRLRGPLAGRPPQGNR